MSFLITVFKVLSNMKLARKHVQLGAEHVMNGALWNSKILLYSP